ncbi:MAG: mercuric transporter MerT family protein [bacterium]
MAVKRGTLSSLGTIAASLLAASCCIGPVIFIIFGTSVGFLSKFAIFSPFRPYLLGAALLMLGYSFWKLYLKKVDCNCEADFRSRRIARGIFWAAASALIISASYLKIVTWFAG